MSKKNKLVKFRANETFECLLQPSTEDVLNKDYKYKGKWNKDIFNNSNPIVLELGCGKGEYTVELAKKYPDKNFIGIDIKGARLWRGAKAVTEDNIPNAKFVRTRIEFICSLFAENEISEIWITFADPQIKRPRKCLTGSLFLNRYNSFLKPDGIINLKTDSLYLYQYSLEIISQNSCTIIHSISDLYSLSQESRRKQDLPEGLTSIRTFYETFFIKRGFTIKYLSFLLDSPNEYYKEPQWDEEYWVKEEEKGRENLPVNIGN